MGQAAEGWRLNHHGKTSSSSGTRHPSSLCLSPRTVGIQTKRGTTSDFTGRAGRQTYRSIISQITHFTRHRNRKMQMRKARASRRGNVASTGQQSGGWERGSKVWTHRKINPDKQVSRLRILNIFSRGLFFCWRSKSDDTFQRASRAATVVLPFLCPPSSSQPQD